MAAVQRSLGRGLRAGAVGGLAFGLFVAFVGNPLVAYAETFEHGHGAGPVVPGVVTAAASVLGGALLGVLLGVAVFGAAFYLLEPAIPGEGAAKSYVLGAAGFVTVSGAPWVLLPPQPPGVEHALAADARIAWYAVMMAVGALACGLSWLAYARLRARTDHRLAAAGALVPLLVVPIAAALAPSDAVAGPVPATVATVFRAVAVTGQVGLWLALASAHAWLGRREGPPVDERPTVRDETADGVSAD